MLSKHQKYFFLVSGIWWLICKTYSSHQNSQENRSKINWSVSASRSFYKKGTFLFGCADSWQGHRNSAWRQLLWVRNIPPPPPQHPSIKDRSPNRRLRPLLFTNSMWVLYRHAEFTSARAVRWGLRFIVHPRRLESLTICRWYYKGSTFSCVVKRPWVFVWLGFKPAASRSEDLRLSNWARSAVEPYLPIANL